MSTRFSTRDKAVIIGLYLSKFDKLALNEFGFDGYRHAFNLLGYSIGVKPASIKNYRDEFDPYFPNDRKGWHKRTLRQYCKKALDVFSDLQFSDFTDLVKSLIIFGYDIESNVSKAIKKDFSESIAKRLATGKAAEEYFIINYSNINEFFDYDIEDARMLACGFDFKLTSQFGFYFVEVKEMNANTGNIVMTEKEYTVAAQFQKQYCLFVVNNFIENPGHKLFFNSVDSSLNFKKNERKIIQIDYSAALV